MKHTLTILTFALIFTISSCDNEQLPYEIKKEEFNENLSKANSTVILEREFTTTELEKVAREIKDEHPNYNRHYIFYYLQDMNLKDAAWAISHFTPELEVEILGVNKEEKEKILATPKPDGKIIGNWFDNRAYVETKMTIYKKDGVLYLRKGYKDGSFGDTELKFENGKYIYENDFGEFLKVEANGELGLYSENGKFASAKEI